MPKTIETLVQDIYDLFHRQDVCIKEEDAEEFGRELASIISSRLTSENQKPMLRLSNLGESCDRKLWLSVNKPEEKEPMPPEALMKFLFGDILESLLLFMAKVAGHSVEGRQDKVEVEGIEGRRDAIIDGVLIDVKSASSFSFKKFENGITKENDAFGYIDQLNGYLSGSQNDTKLLVKDKAYWLVIDKTLGKILLAECPVSPKVRQRAIFAKEMIKSEQMPARAFLPEEDGKSGNMKLGLKCSYCEVKKTCWPGLRTFLYSSGPRFLTKVEKEPDVKEI